MTAAFNLRRERFDRGLTLNELAEKTGVSRSTLIRIEQGAVPNAPVALAIAEWLGTKPSELWPEEATAA
jgi:transcriptional regulator with XRE-family HTH domain